MARRRLLSPEQWAGFLAAPTDERDILRYYTLSRDDLDLNVDLEASAVWIRAEVRAFDRTGVEMEALNAVTTAALTVYDMCKAVDRGMEISEVRLEAKSGGASGGGCSWS